MGGNATKKRNEEMYMYWYNGSFGRTGWWFDSKKDDRGLLYNSKDSQEVPQSGWRDARSVFKTPRPIRIQVKPPVIEAPPSRSKEFSGGSCFQCFAGLIGNDATASLDWERCNC